MAGAHWRPEVGLAQSATSCFHGATQANRRHDCVPVQPTMYAAGDLSRPYRAAKYPYYSHINLRRGSFLSWPDDKDQTPATLSEAGFYYAGMQDCTRCFYCGGGLRNWLPGDNPWVEHARWFPECEFIRQEKGDNFVNNVNQDYPRDDVEVLETDTDTDTSVTDINEIVQRVLKAPCGASLEVLRFPPTVIIAAITKVLSESDWDEKKVTAEKLANVAFDLQDAESESVSAMENVYENGLDHTDSSFPECESSVIDGESSCPDRSKLLQENSRLKSQMMCRVCRRNSVSNVFLPCGHLITCPDCGMKQTHCVLCHQTVAANIKVYV